MNRSGWDSGPNYINPTDPIPGAYDDQTNSGRRMKPRGKRRKRFAIEARYITLRKNSILNRLTRFTCGWYTHSRYATESSRDQAYAALVKKEERASLPGWGRWKYRKG